MSPIHDQSYRRYAGKRRPLGQSWAVIADTGIRSMLARKWFLALLLFAWIPFIVRTVQIYAVTMYPTAGQVVPVDAKMFMQFVEQQGTFIFFVTVFVGSGLIAADRRANALQVYLSKPLLRMEYIAGKLAILATFLTFVTIVPALLLIVPPGELFGQPGVSRNNLLPGACGRAREPDAGHRVVVRHARAVIALEEHALRGDSGRGHHLFHGSRVRRACCHYGLDARGMDFNQRQSREHHRRHVQADATLRDAGHRLGSGPARPDRGVDLGARTARPGCRGGRVSAPILTAEHLSKWYGQVIGLNDVSVSVPSGITGLLGPNGAGKSTFMKLITGQLRPSKGDVKVLGEPIWGDPKLFFRIGFCPEQDAFYDRMTGLSG